MIIADVSPPRLRRVATAGLRRQRTCCPTRGCSRYVRAMEEDPDELLWWLATAFVSGAFVAGLIAAVRAL